MLPGIEMMACTDLAVPAEVMSHVARVESSFNPYAIGVVGGRLVRQPKSLDEAVSTARMLEEKGYNFSLGISQVNRYNLAKYGLGSYEKAFQVCPNVVAGAQILAECYGRSGSDWGKAFSCYYSGNFVTGYRHGYVQKVYASIAAAAQTVASAAIPLADSGRTTKRRDPSSERIAAAAAVDTTLASLATRRGGAGARVEGHGQAWSGRVVAEHQEVIDPTPTQTAPTPSAHPRQDGYQAPAAPAAVVMLGSTPSPQFNQAAPVRPSVQRQQPVAESGSHDSALVF